MSRYAMLTQHLLANPNAQFILSFDELDKVVLGGLPTSARQYHAWWANNAASQGTHRASRDLYASGDSTPSAV
jgi:hypothetical protein